MTPEMAQWIAAHVIENPKGMCRYFVDYMAETFPELRRVRGYYYEPSGAHHPHWWLALPTGDVVDPTIVQFEPGGSYVEFTGPDPVGQCFNCGDLVWEAYNTSPCACSKACFDEISRDFAAEGGRKRA